MSGKRKDATPTSLAMSSRTRTHKLPVLVEFMGVWSEPCLLTADALSDLAREFPGQFVFANVDVDEQSALGEQYELRNVPTLVVFKGGEVALAQEGQRQRVRG